MLQACSQIKIIVYLNIKIQEVECCSKQRAKVCNAWNLPPRLNVYKETNYRLQTYGNLQKTNLYFYNTPKMLIKVGNITYTVINIWILLNYPKVLCWNQHIRLISQSLQNNHKHRIPLNKIALFSSATQTQTLHKAWGQ